MYQHEMPVLDLTWSSVNFPICNFLYPAHGVQSGQHLFSSGCDHSARMYDLQTGQSQQVAAHDAPIRCCEYTDAHGGLLVTAGWDKKLKVGCGDELPLF